MGILGIVGIEKIYYNATLKSSKINYYYSNKLSTIKNK